MHISLVDAVSGANLFVASCLEPQPKWSELKHVSMTGRYFLAGVLDGLGDVMALMFPTINSYRRLDGAWHPRRACWGIEQRMAAVRLIVPPTTDPQNVRMEVRLPGADANAAYVLAAIFALGLRGIQNRLDVSVPPLGIGQDIEALSGPALPNSLKDATERFIHKDSLAERYSAINS